MLRILGFIFLVVAGAAAPQRKLERSTHDFPVPDAVSLPLYDEDACLFNPVLGNDMVLQRNVPARVWGTAIANTNLTIVLTSSGGKSETYQTIASSTGMSDAHK